MSKKENKRPGHDQPNPGHPLVELGADPWRLVAVALCSDLGVKSMSTANSSSLNLP